MQPLQQPPDDPSDQAAFGLPRHESPPQQLQQLQQGSVQNNSNSMSPFPRPSSPFIFSSSNPTSPSFSISDASSYGSPTSCVSPYSPNCEPSFDSTRDASRVQVGPAGLANPVAQFSSGPHSASDASNLQAAPIGLFNPSTQFVSNPDPASDASAMHTPPIGSFSSMTQFAYNFDSASGVPGTHLSAGFLMTDYAPSYESTIDPSIMQATPHGVFTPMRQLTTPSSYPMNGDGTHGFNGTMAQSPSFAPLSFSFPPPPPPPSFSSPQDPMLVAIKELEELERQYQEILNRTATGKQAPPPQAPPPQATPIPVINLDEPMLYISDEQEESPPPSNNSQDNSFIVSSPEPYCSGATVPIQRLLQPLQPWNSGVQQSQQLQLQPDGRSYGQHPQPRNHTKVDLWSMSSASQLSVGATSPTPDDPFNTKKQTELPKTIVELLSGVRDETMNDEGSPWTKKPAAARDRCDDEEDSDCTFVAPSPYSHVAPSPWVPQNKLLLTSMGPPPPPSPAAPAFAVPSKPAPKPTVDTELALNSFQGEQRQIIVGLMDKIKELTDEKEKAEKEKKKPVIEGNSYFDKTSLARRTNPAIFQFPARNGREVQLDLCRAMVGYTEISRMSKTSISNFVKHVLNTIHEDPMASQRVTAACAKSTKGYRVLSQSSMRTMAKFWMAHFKHTHEHSLTRITDLMTFTIKNLLDKNRSEVVVRGMQSSSSKST